MIYVMDNFYSEYWHRLGQGELDEAHSLCLSTILDGIDYLSNDDMQKLNRYSRFAKSVMRMPHISSLFVLSNLTKRPVITEILHYLYIDTSPILEPDYNKNDVLIYTHVSDGLLLKLKTRSLLPRKWKNASPSQRRTEKRRRNHTKSIIVKNGLKIPPHKNGVHYQLRAIQLASEKIELYLTTIAIRLIEAEENMHKTAIDSLRKYREHLSIFLKPASRYALIADILTWRLSLEAQTFPGGALIPIKFTTGAIKKKIIDAKNIRRPKNTASSKT